MADAEVKIHVSADADLKGMDDAAKKADDLAKGRSQTASEANPRPAAAPVPSTSVLPAGYEALEKRRDELKALRREAQDLERQGDTRGARDTTRRADKLEKSIDREGARLLRVEDEEQKRAAKTQADAEREKAAAAKALAAEERAATRQRKTDEQMVTRELREQEAMRRAGITAMRAGLSVAGGALIGNVLPQGVDVIAGEESIANRRVATAARNQRQAAILNSIRGTSAQVSAEAWAAEDNIAQLERERPQLESDRKYDTAKSGLSGAAIGAGGALALAALLAPVTGGTSLGVLAAIAGTGGLIGGATQGGFAWMDGTRRLKQHDQDKEQEEERAKAMSALAPELFKEQEGGLMMDRLRARSRRSLEGSREAFVNEFAEQWLGIYRDIYNRTKGNDAMAKEVADLTVENNLRDRQAAAGAGLVDARSGGADIAAAARWAMGSSPGQAEVGAKIDMLHATVQEGNQRVQLVNQAK